MEIVFKLTIEEANLVLTALGELPYKISCQLIQKLKTQGESQVSDEKPIEIVPTDMTRATN